MIFEELENGEVLIVEEIKTDTQTAIVKNHYDRKYHTRLRYENQKVIAEVWTYLDEQATDFNENIIFEYEGEQITVQAINGVAEIDFVADQGMEHTVKTVNPMFRNGEVTFSV